MVEVSIIMPVYNSMKYVKRAIESVISQSFQNWELIIVNDGSTDESGSICQAYSNLDNRVHYYEKENGGICSARNYGLKRAKGKYIAFLDNDDEYKYNLLEDNLKLIQKYDAQMIKFQKSKIYIQDGEIKSIVKKDLDPQVLFFKHNELINNFPKLAEYGGTIWNCIFKRKFLLENNILFNENVKNIIEDHEFNYQCYKYLESIVLNPKEYYFWYVRIEHSTTGKFIYERFDNIKDMAEMQYSIFESKGVFESNPLYWSRLKEEYLINIILVMNYPNSSFSFKSAKKYLKSLKSLNIFKRKITLKEYKYLSNNTSILRAISIVLFDYGFLYTLWFLSTIKMKKEVESGIRRF